MLLALFAFDGRTDCRLLCLDSSRSFLQGVFTFGLHPHALLERLWFFAGRGDTSTRARLLAELLGNEQILKPASLLVTGGCGRTLFSPVLPRVLG